MGFFINLSTVSDERQKHVFHHSVRCTDREKRADREREKCRQEDRQRHRRHHLTAAELNMEGKPELFVLSEKYYLTS